MKKILKNYKSLIILLSAIIIVSASSRILNYYYDSDRLFTIEENKDNYKVVTKNVVQCIRAPCNPLIVEEKTITNKEDNENLKIVFDEIFKDNDTETKVKNLYYSKLTSRQNEIIKTVLERNKIIYNLDYTIIDDLDEYNSEYNKRGYYYEEKNDKAIVTIAMGKKPSSGYSINVEKIENDESEVTIDVYESKPPEDASVTHALTYPVVQIKFKQIPSKVNVIDAETGESFSLINEPTSRIYGSFLNVKTFLLFLIFFIL
jgi:hypothetical protein